MKQAKDTWTGRIIEISICPLSQKELHFKAEENIPDPGNIKGTADAKKGKAGLNSLGVSFLTALPVFLNVSVPKSKNLSIGLFNSLGMYLS